jgi:hypothetical protein
LGSYKELSKGQTAGSDFVLYHVVMMHVFCVFRGAKLIVFSRTISKVF